MGQSRANIQELDYDEIRAQWYDPDYWTSIQAMADPIDEMIESFNARIDG